MKKYPGSGRLAQCLLAGFSIFAPFLLAQATESNRGAVQVRDNVLLRDGARWIPHGYYQIAFEVAPANLARADHPFWATAYNNYTAAEYRYMQEAGADSVRLQIAQAGADPKSPLYDPSFVAKAVGAVRSAREAGLTVMVCVQDESHVPGDHPIDLPNEGTRRVWKEIAPQFAKDHGVLFELLNEPRPAPTPQNWRRWAQAMNETTRAIRQTGAGNVLIADGLAVGQVLDGAPLLDDPQVVYASHPYALKAQGQTRAVWDAKFGNFSHRAPVIITEWLSGGYYCDADTPASTVDFLKYLQTHNIGLEAGTWDWAPAGFGSARWDFPHGRDSTFSGLACHEAGYGMGNTVQSWYRTGIPPTQPE